MPELPEVELYRRYFSRHALRKKIKNVEVESPRILKGISAQQLNLKLKGKEFKSAKRHGKYLFANINENLNLVLHFGMTGDLIYYKNEEDKAPYARLLINFSNGHHLAFDDPRKFGAIALTKNISDFIKEKNLGSDPLSDSFKYRDFKRILEGKKGTIKSILMDQKLIAGVGNIYSDEILFQAGIYPGKPLDKIKEESLRKIFDWLKKILNTTVKSKADFKSYPDDYLVLHRKKNDDCPVCGGTIQWEKIAGRSSYFCSKHQK